MNHSTVLAALLLATLASADAAAASYGDTSPIYVGAGVGRSQLSADCGGGVHCKAHDNGSGKLYAGFNFAPASWWSGSEVTYSLELAGYVGEKARVQARYGQRGFAYDTAFRGGALQFKSMLRETESLYLQAHAGVAGVSARRSAGGWELPSHSKTGLAGGFGFSYAMGRQLSLTIDYDFLQARFSVFEDKHIHMLTFGASYKL